jgi:hypothetical protein
MPAHRTPNWASRERGQLVAEGRLAEDAARNTERVEPGHDAPQAVFGTDAEQYKVRMVVRRGQEMSCRFDARMAGLDCLLRHGQITANESVEVRCVCFRGRYLEEIIAVHGQVSLVAGSLHLQHFATRSGRCKLFFGVNRSNRCIESSNAIKSQVGCR